MKKKQKSHDKDHFFYASSVNDEYSQLKKIEIKNNDELHNYKNPTRQINKPNRQQIERILEYKKKFASYSKRNTYLSNSDINEIKLFDR